MTNYFTLLPSLIVVLLMSQTSVLATKTVADDLGESESPIDIMGTVADHDYFTFFGTKLYLPRIFLWKFSPFSMPSYFISSRVSVVNKLGYES